MQGLILAAGRGSRLGNYNGGTPKCLLEIGRRRLIDHQLETFAEAGVAPMGIVVGYCADEVKECVGIRAEYVHNLRWETTNSIYSFWLARDWFKGPLVVANCDVLFHPEILARLLATKTDAIAYDSSSGAGLEHMKVSVVDGCVADMSKTLPASETSGENVGLLYLTESTTRALCERAGAIIAAGGEKGWLGAAMRELAQQRPIRAVDIAGLPWGEIDSAYDLEHVRKNVWPEIRQSTGKNSLPPLHLSASRATSRSRTVRAGLAGASLLMATGGISYAWVWDHPGDRSWDMVEVTGVPSLPITLPDRTQRWWVIGEDRPAMATFEGPGPIRIESRLLLAPAMQATKPYVIKVELDGTLFDLIRETAPPDPGLRHHEWALAKRKRAEVVLPAGRHTVAISLLDAEGECLIRVREPEDEGETLVDAESEAEAKR